MAIKNDKIVVDFIPVIENADAKKVRDHGLIKFNQIILSIFNQLQTPKGTLTDYPDIGCMDYLLELYFSETQFDVINKIRENINKYKKEQISLDLIKDNDNKSVNISITVENIPNFKFTADLVKDNNYVKIVNPQIFQM